MLWPTHELALPVVPAGVFCMIHFAYSEEGGAVSEPTLVVTVRCPSGGDRLTYSLTDGDFTFVSGKFSSFLNPNIDVRETVALMIADAILAHERNNECGCVRAHLARGTVRNIVEKKLAGCWGDA